MMGTATATRSVNLTGVTHAHFTFWAKLDLLVAGSTSAALVSIDGETFTPAFSWTQVDSDNEYTSYEVDLGSIGLMPASQVWVRFELEGSGALWIDDVEIN